MSIIARCLFLLWVLLGVLAAPGAAADKPTPVPFRVLWMIEPQQVPLDPVTVRHGEAAVKARLLPSKLARLVGDVSHVNGVKLLPSGATLIVLDSPKMVACTITIPAFAQTMKPKSSLWSKQNRYFCMTDYNSDGQFEGYFWLYTHLLGSLQGQALLPPVEGGIEPTAYVLDKPEKAVDPPTLYLLSSGGGRFIVVPQSPNNEVPLLATVGPGIRVDTKALPSRFSLYGGEFEVLSNAKGKVTIRTIKPFAPEPFFVHR